jgi:UDP-glucose 4-epimerase
MALCLVTGGAGFIGGHLTEALVNRGDRVRVLDDLSTGRPENLAAVSDQVELIRADINDRDAVAKAMEGVELVFHEAALASVPRSVVAPLETHAACATGTLTILDCARMAGVKRFVYAASSSAYGDQPTPLKRESDQPMPLSPYAAAKLAGEHYCHSFFHTYGLATVCLRYFNVFGPRQDPNGPYAAVIPIFTKLLLAGKSPVIFGDGLQTRDFTFVQDVVQANLKAADATVGGVTLNVGSGRRTSLLELLSEINRLLGTSVSPELKPARAGDVRDSLADISLARETIGYEPKFSLVEGLVPTVEFYRARS